MLRARGPIREADGSAGCPATPSSFVLSGTLGMEEMAALLREGDPNMTDRHLQLLFPAV